MSPVDGSSSVLGAMPRLALGIRNVAGASTAAALTSPRRLLSSRDVLTSAHLT